MSPSIHLVRRDHVKERVRKCGTPRHSPGEMNNKRTEPLLLFYHSNDLMPSKVCGQFTEDRKVVLNQVFVVGDTGAILYKDGLNLANEVEDDIKNPQRLPMA